MICLLFLIDGHHDKLGWTFRSIISLLSHSTLLLECIFSVEIVRRVTVRFEVLQDFVLLLQLVQEGVPFKSVTIAILLL